RYADVAVDQKATSTFLSNYTRQSLEQTDELLAGKFETQTYQCRLKTISQVISEQHIERIDLLKIDVERSELDVLEGIAEDDWPRIKQIVVEVDAAEGRLDCVVKLLQDHGYEFEIEQSELLKHTSLYKLFARQQGQASAPAIAAANGGLKLRRLSSTEMR